MGQRTVWTAAVIEMILCFLYHRFLHVLYSFPDLSLIILTTCIYHAHACRLLSRRIGTISNKKLISIIRQLLSTLKLTYFVTHANKSNFHSHQWTYIILIRKTIRKTSKIFTVWFQTSWRLKVGLYLNTL